MTYSLCRGIVHQPASPESQRGEQYIRRVPTPIHRDIVYR